MDFTKKLNNVSFPAMAISSIVLLMLLNGLAYLIFTIVFKIPFLELFNKTWIILILTPVSLGVIHSFMNLDGIITIKSQDKTSLLLLKVKGWLMQREYLVIESNSEKSIFEYKTIWKKLIGLNSGRVVISNTNKVIEITGNRNILFLIMSKLKYDKGLLD